MALKDLIWNIIVPSWMKTGKKQRCSEVSVQDSRQKHDLRRHVLLDCQNNPDSIISAGDLYNIGTNLHRFKLEELQVITSNFSKSNFLGRGGFGKVYKGFIEAQPVAVKKLDMGGSQGDKEWLAEVFFLGELKHPNVVKLIGYCWKCEHRLLVYEYMEGGNLQDQLLAATTLSWSVRLKIAVGAAKGLAFLHGRDKPVIHRDFKAENLLLDNCHNAKITDFGLATEEEDDDDEKQVSTLRCIGTKGYIAPEYYNDGRLTRKVDAYSFGVVLLVLLTREL